MSLCDHLHDPEHIAEALRVGMSTFDFMYFVDQLRHASEHLLLVPIRRPIFVIHFPLYVNVYHLLHNYTKLIYCCFKKYSTLFKKKSGIAESLKVLLTDGDLTVRQKATECLFVIGGKEGTKEHYKSVRNVVTALCRVLMILKEKLFLTNFQ